MTPEDKLMAARCKLITINPFYGHMGMQMDWIKSDFNWIPDELSKTMGISAARGRINCYWYPGFVESRTIHQLFGAIQHEIEHLVRMHLARSSKKRDALPWNIANDMCVNGRQDSPRIGCLEGDKFIIPIGNDEGQMAWIPNDWPDDETSEYYYDRIMKSDDFKWAKNLSNTGQCYKGMVDDHSKWKYSEMSNDEIRQVVNDMSCQAVHQSCGKIPGHLMDILSKLSTPIVSWRQILRRFFGRHLGDHRKTYSRRDRRKDKFGLPGISHHASARASCIIDTSGSISNEDLEQFFAEIESIAYRTKLCILQWDHAFQGFMPRYRNGDWKKIKIKGRGGTDMIAPVEWLENNGLIGDVCIMLTDGYCDYIKKKPFPMVTCITTTDGSKPDWGTVIRMKNSG